MVALDPRVHPFRPEIAARHLKGQVEAERFVEGTRYEVIDPNTPLRPPVSKLFRRSPATVFPRVSGLSEDRM